MPKQNRGAACLALITMVLMGWPAHAVPVSSSGISTAPIATEDKSPVLPDASARIASPPTLPSPRLHATPQRKDVTGELKDPVDALREQVALLTSIVSSGLAIGGWVLAIGGLVLPFLTYLTALLPARKASRKAQRLEVRLKRKFVALDDHLDRKAGELDERFKQLEGGLAKTFDELLSSAEKRRFDALIDQLRNPDLITRRHAATRLIGHDPDAFTDTHLTLVEHALRRESDALARAKLATSVFCRASTIADRLASDILRREVRPGLEGEALTYLSRTPGDPRLELVGTWLEKSPDRRADASNILATAAALVPQLLPQLLNQPIWRTHLKAFERVTLVGTIRGWISSGLLTQQQVEDSPWASVFGRVVAFAKIGDGGVLSFSDDPDDPEHPDLAWIYEKERMRQTHKGSPEFANLVEEARRALEAERRS